MNKMTVIARTLHPAENELVQRALAYYSEAMAKHAAEEAAAGREASHIIPSILAAKTLSLHTFATVGKQRR